MDDLSFFSFDKYPTFKLSTQSHALTTRPWSFDRSPSLASHNACYAWRLSASSWREWDALSFAESPRQSWYLLEKKATEEAGFLTYELNYPSSKKFSFNLIEFPFVLSSRAGNTQAIPTVFRFPSPNQCNLFSCCFDVIQRGKRIPFSLNFIKKQIIKTLFWMRIVFTVFSSLSFIS